jgi:curli biogenesis system outer membrane secretion channel CsgG
MEKAMTLTKYALLLLVAFQAVAWAQIPADAAPQPPREPVPQMPQMPQIPFAPPALPAPTAPAVNAPALPHQGNLPNAPTSTASQRRTQLPTATIREFRSSVAEVTPRAATDMFITALVKTRQFRVLERARLAEGVAAEKSLNQQGMTTGQAGQSQYIAATFLFEATISEASSGDRKSTFTLGLAGAAAGRGTQSDSLAIDVRITDVESGVVVDAVTVRKEIKLVETKLGGVASALANILSKGRAGHASELLTPNDSYSSERKDSVDATLREAINDAVRDITKRLVQE